MKKYVFLLSITTLIVCFGSVAGSHEIRQPTKSYSFVKESPVSVYDLILENNSVDGIIIIAERNGSLKYIVPNKGSVIMYYNDTYAKNLKINSRSLQDLNWKICARHKC